MNDAIIVSDIHLGSNICQSKSLQKFLDNLPATQRLIINGDLFDSWDFRRLKRNHWKILETLRRISKNTKLVWLKGNHDNDAENVSHLIGAAFSNELMINSDKKFFLILHGDIFDKFITNHPILTKIADYFYRVIQYFDAYWNTNYYYSSLAKRNSKTFLRCSEQICERAKMYGSIHHADFVICGHTHHAMINTNGNVHYYNGGSWTEQNCSYITIKNGQCFLEYFDNLTVQKRII